MPILGDSTVRVFNSLWTPHAHTAVKGKGYKSTASSRCFTFRAEFISLLEAACNDVSTEQYETPTQQQLSILTPPTGFRTEARTDVCETQCDEEGDHVELTTPLTTNAANMIGLKKECSVTQPLCHFQVQSNSVRRLHLHPHRLKPLPLGHLCCGVPQLAKPCKVQLSSYKF